MKTIIFLAAVLLFIVSGNLMTFAQSDDDYGYRGICGDRAGYMSDYLDSRLDLSDDQYSKVYSIFLDHEKQRDEDFEKYSDDRDAFRDASNKRRQKLDSELKGVLTTGQYTEYEQIRSQMYSKMKNKFGRYNGWRKSQGWLDNISKKVCIAGR